MLHLNHRLTATVEQMHGTLDITLPQQRVTYIRGCTSA